METDKMIDSQMEMIDKIFARMKSIVDKHYPKVEDKDKVDAVSRLSSTLWENLWGAKFHAYRDKVAKDNVDGAFGRAMGELRGMMGGK